MNQVKLLPSLQTFLVLLLKQPWSSKIEFHILNRNRIEMEIHGRHFQVYDFCYSPDGSFRWYTEDEGNCLILTFADQHRSLLSSWIYEYEPVYGLNLFLDSIQWLVDHDEEPGDWTAVD